MDADFVYPWINVDQDEKGAATIVNVDGSTTTTGRGDFIWNDQWQCKATCTHPSSEINKQRNYLMTNQIKEMFGEVPVDLESFVTASQIVQAEAKKYFIEFWRMNKGERNGILWWNLRDGWPIVSDAVVDYYGGKKLAYDYIKNVQTDVCVMVGDIREGDSGHPLVVVNDTRKSKEVEIVVKDKVSGRIILSKKVDVEANGILKMDELTKVKKDELWLIEYKVNDKRYKNHYLAYTAPMDFENYKSWLSDLR